MHIFSDISRRKGNQTLKFSPLIEYNMRNILCFIQFVFIVYPSQGLLKHIEAKVESTCFYLI